MFPAIDNAHGTLVRAVEAHCKPGGRPIPITLVSVTETPQGQLVIFDGTKFAKDEVVARLRTAADFLETQPTK